MPISRHNIWIVCPVGAGSFRHTSPPGRAALSRLAEPAWEAASSLQAAIKRFRGSACRHRTSLSKQFGRFFHAAGHGNAKGAAGFTAFASDTVFRIGGKLVIVRPQCARNLVLHN